jgi:hypothetical protein
MGSTRSGERIAAIARNCSLKNVSTVHGPEPVREA